MMLGPPTIKCSRGSASEDIDSQSIKDDNNVYQYLPSATEDIGGVAEDVFHKIPL